MLEIVRLDASDPLSVVDHFSPRLDQGVENDVAVEVDDGDAGQSVALLCEDPLAVKCQDLCLSATNMSQNDRIELTFRVSSPG